jgi:protein SCO1/2
MKSGKAAKRAARARKTLGLASIGVAGILLLAGALMWVAAPGQKARDSASQIGGPFTLTGDNGAVLTEHSFGTRYLLVYFGYTRCRDVCPETLNNVTAALERMGQKAALVQPLFITIDPAHDTPAVLHQYVAAFSPRLIGLSGGAASLQAAAEAYHVAVQPHGEGAAMQIDHSSVLYLMAPDGHFVAPIPADANEMVLAAALLRYVS